MPKFDPSLLAPMKRITETKSFSSVLHPDVSWEFTFAVDMGAPSFLKAYDIADSILEKHGEGTIPVKHQDDVIAVDRRLANIVGEFMAAEVAVPVTTSEGKTVVDPVWTARHWIIFSHVAPDAFRAVQAWYRELWNLTRGLGRDGKPVSDAVEDSEEAEEQAAGNA